MVKNLIICFILIVLIVLLIIFILDSMKVKITKEERLANMGITYDELKEDFYDIGNEISFAIKHNDAWNRLFLSDNFKKKYKNGRGILPNKRDFCWIDGTTIKKDGKKLIIIVTDKKEPLFDFDDSDAITTEFYFDYVLDEHNEIDDIILVETIDTDAMTGRPIEK